MQVPPALPPASRPPRRHRRWIAWLSFGTLAVASCVGIRYMTGPAAAGAAAPAGARAAPGRRTGSGSPGAQGRAADARPDIVAVVNGEPIDRKSLGRLCLTRFGEDVLESLINRKLIERACLHRNLVVSAEDVQAEIERMAHRFHLRPEQWIKMLETERGITPKQYARDIVWPSLALQRLAASRLTVEPEELRQAYENQYGPAVKARLIAVSDPNKARRLHAQLQADPDAFARLAREQSEDVGSASIGGLVPPIRRHTGYEEIEQVVFRMNQGDVSPIVRVGEQYAIFKCEGHVPQRNVPFQQVKSALAETIRDRKLRESADDVFRDLQSKTVVRNVYNHADLRKQMPGVAATVDREPITLDALADACIARHGQKVLAKEIDKRLLAQELRKRNLRITQRDLDAEVAHAAEWAGVLDERGKPDVRRWLKMATEEQGLAREAYYADAVWPSAALKKLSSGKLDVSEEELQKGFEANYGPRVRCRAIVMSNLRRAQEVWAKARENPTPEHFGQLARQHSTDLASRENRGEIPPIRKNSGRPALEQEAFALSPSQPLSGVVQVGERYVILFFEGRTEPIEVTLAEVRDLLYRDIHEKKLRLVMADTFDAIEQRATIDNYLAGTSQSPARAADAPRRAAESGSPPRAALQPKAPTRPAVR